MQIITEVLQSIKASDMTPLLKRIYESDGGNECLDVLMKYMYVELTYSGVGKGLVLTLLPSSYKGMGSGQSDESRRTSAKVTPQSTGGFSQIGARPGASNEPASATMSVLLSWHEKLVEVAGIACICRTMTDWRRV